jgi:hypothetical protein
VADTVANTGKWFTSTSATNMANMLSSQLGAMAMNVYNNLGKYGTQVNANWVVYTEANGFETVGDLMADADASLGQYATTLGGDANRAKQEILKNALDIANNNGAKGLPYVLDPVLTYTP